MIRNSVPLVDFVRLQSVTRLGPPLLSLTLLGFLAPSAFWLRKATCTGISKPRLRSVFRFSQPLDVFFLPDPFRPCFMPMTLLGFLPSEVSPPVRRDGLSTSLPLLTFTPTRSSPIVCCDVLARPSWDRHSREWGHDGPSSRFAGSSSGVPAIRKSVRPASGGYTVEQESFLSWVFIPFRVFPSPAMAWPSPRLLSCPSVSG